jgi:hypothetical protein
MHQVGGADLGQLDNHSMGEIQPFDEIAVAALQGADDGCGVIGSEKDPARSEEFLSRRIVHFSVSSFAGIRRRGFMWRGLVECFGAAT